jgi:threonine/homoserine/homoserine lactone efflux protein
LPPGLISLSVAHTAMQRGWWAAIVLAAGAAAAEFFQAWGAVLLTDWFLSHRAAERAFQWAAVPVFLGLAGYLLFWAKPPKPPAEIPPISVLRQFAKGLIISVFNLLAIPYWFVYCGWLRVEGWWREGWASTMFFSAGVALGTVVALALYAWLGHLILQRSAGVARQANRVVGLLFLGLGLRLLWGLW